MINPLRGEVAITIDGAERILRPTMDAIVKWETATDQSTWELARALSDRSIRMAAMANIIVAAAVDGLTQADVGAEIERSGTAPLFSAALQLLANTLTRGVEVTPGEADATEPETT
jgi:hypothetical protein